MGAQLLLETAAELLLLGPRAPNSPAEKASDIRIVRGSISPESVTSWKSCPAMTTTMQGAVAVYSTMSIITRQDPCRR